MNRIFLALGLLSSYAAYASDTVELAIILKVNQSQVGILKPVVNNYTNFCQLKGIIQKRLMSKNMRASNIIINATMPDYKLDVSDYSHMVTENLHGLGTVTGTNPQLKLEAELIGFSKV